jgi:hypothetical protein
LEEFDEILLRIIDKTIRNVFGDRNTGIIYDYLGKSGCPMHEIPTKPNQFSVKLRKILGSGRGQLLGAAPILEEMILEALCAELKIKVDMQSATCFADRIKKLRRVYDENRGPRRLANLEGRTTQSLHKCPCPRSEVKIVALRKDKNPSGQ